MTSYRVEVRQCPNCACEFSFWAVNSCNTLGAKFYTDGFIDGRMYVDGSDLLACPKCNTYFWRDDVPIRKSLRDYEYFDKPEWKSLPEASQLHGRDYEYLLPLKLWRNKTEEEYVRIRAWWSFNAEYRLQACEDFKLPAEQEENLERLLHLLDTNNQHSLVMKAEILRELGQFDECLRAINQVSDNRYSKVVNVIKKLAKSSTRQVGLVA